MSTLAGSYDISCINRMDSRRAKQLESVAWLASASQWAGCEGLQVCKGVIRASKGGPKFKWARVLLFTANLANPAKPSKDSQSSCLLACLPVEWRASIRGACLCVNNSHTTEPSMPDTKAKLSHHRFEPDSHESKNKLPHLRGQLRSVTVLHSRSNGDHFRWPWSKCRRRNSRRPFRA